MLNQLCYGVTLVPRLAEATVEMALYSHFQIVSHFALHIFFYIASHFATACWIIVCCNSKFMLRMLIISSKKRQDMQLQKSVPGKCTVTQKNKIQDPINQSKGIGKKTQLAVEFQQDQGTQNHFSPNAHFLVTLLLVADITETN